MGSGASKGGSDASGGGRGRLARQSKADKARAAAAKKVERQLQNRVCKPLLQQAHRNETAVTPLLQEACTAVGGGAQLIGLEHRFKSLASLTRKVGGGA